MLMTPLFLESFFPLHILSRWENYWYPKALSYKKVVVCSNKVVAHSSKEVRTREEEDSFHCVNRSKDPTDFL